MAKKEPTEQKSTVDFATQFAELGTPEPADTHHVETAAEAAVRKRIEDNGQTKEALQEIKEKLVGQPSKTSDSLDPELLEQAAKSADAALKAAKQLVKAAEEKVKLAQKECDDIALLRMQFNQQTDEERNREYLESQKKQRVDAATEQQSRLQAMLNAGLISREELQKLCPSVTPLDQAIADRNKRKRISNNEVYRRA